MAGRSAAAKASAARRRAAKGVVALAAQLEDRGEAALCLREAALVAAAIAVGRQLTPGFGGFGHLAGDLGAASVALERLQPQLHFLALWPQLQRLARRPRRVAMGVDCLGLLGGPDQRRPGAGLLAGTETVSGNLEARALVSFRRLGQAAVQLPPPHPGDVGVERFLGERVAEADLSQLHLFEQAPLDQLGQPSLADDPAGEAEVELRPGDRCPLGRLTSLLGEIGGGDQDGFANGVGHRHLLLVGQLEPAPARPQGISYLQGRDQLLDEEGRAQGSVMDGPHERKRGGFGEQGLEQLRHSLAVERLQRNLLQAAGAPQLVPQPAQAMVAPEAVGAVGGEHEDRHLLQRLGKCRQQFQGRLVGPLQVVEDDRQRLRLAEVGEGAADRLEDRLAPALWGGLGELGEEEGEVGEERTAAVERVRLLAKLRAQGGDDRAVGDR